MKLLSICMMVKDEEKNLPRCLESLKPLMQQVDSELIIVDTGSTDNTVNIAKSYTDRVYFHPWNNNFSEMRNITISYAQGEWILILDADEELVDFKDILTFLSRSELREFYGACTIYINSSLTPGKTEDDTMLPALRLFKNDGFFHYEQSIHEQPKWQGQVLRLESVIQHYGYDSTDQELMEKKFERTSQLLLEELNKDPNNIYYRYQLAVTYGMHQDLKEALGEIRKAYDTIHKKEVDPWQFIYVYERYVVYAIASKQWDEAEKICLEGISLEPEYFDLHFSLARIYEVQGKYSVAIENFKEYLRLVRGFSKLALAGDPRIQFYTKGKENEALLELSKLYLLTEDFTSALQTGGQLIDRAKNLDSSVIEQALTIYIKAAFEIQEFKKLKNIYRKLSNNDHRGYFLKVLEDQQRNLSNNERVKISKLFSREKDVYGKLNQIRLAYQEDRLAESQELLQELAQELDFNSEPVFYADLFYFLIVLKQPWADIFRRINQEKADALLAFMCNSRPKVKELIEPFVQSLSNTEDFSLLRLSRMLFRNTLLYSNLSDEEYLRLFNLYVRIGNQYLKLLYSPLALKTQNWAALDQEDRFILLVSQAEQEKIMGNYRQAIRILRNALNNYPQMNKGIEILTKDLQALAEARAQEFEHYARLLKEKIEVLINNDELTTATLLLEEATKVIAEDSDIVSMKAVIFLKQGEFIKAEKLLQMALGKDPQNFDLLYNLACALEAQQKVGKAIHYYQKASQACLDRNMEAVIREHIFELRKGLAGKELKKH
ncbi:MAG: glycosyltransferase [Peptococcaceae bacterium]|nr:glycosyltransferase [Peptococcaceae bacterium]